jgi:hypothetical protein
VTVSARPPQESPVVSPSLPTSIASAPPSTAPSAPAPSTPPPAVPQRRGVPEPLQTLQQQFLALEETYHTQLHIIEQEYATALQHTAPAPPRRYKRRRRDAYRTARQKQEDVYRETRRQWEELFASYQQVLRRQQTAQEEERGSR